MVGNQPFKSYSDLEHMSDSECYEVITTFVTFPPFRVIQILQLLLSFTSLFSMAYVELRYVLKFTFHRNMKMILTVTYLMGMIDAFINTIMQITQLVMTTAMRPCESFPSKWFYEVTHMTLAAFTVGMVIMMLMVMCERAIATFSSRNYEKTGTIVGICLSGLGVGATAAIILTTYRSSDFNELKPSVLFIPSSAFHRAVRMVSIEVVACLVCVFGMLMLIVVNNNKCSREFVVLTSRYQIRENIAATKIAIYLVGFQTALFLSYIASGTIIYLYQKELFGDNAKAFTTARFSFYLMPLFTFSLPIFTAFLIRRYRSERSGRIQSMVALQSAGDAGSRNYNDVIQKMWEKRGTA